MAFRSDDDRPYMPGSTFRRPRTGLQPVNWERRNRRTEADEVYGSHHKAIMTLPCALASHPDHKCASYTGRHPIEGHHLKTVATGGQDRNNQLPLCNAGHDELHADGSVWASCERLGWDLRSLACEYTKRVDRLMADTQTGE